MTGYDPRATLDAISANAVPVVLVGGLSILAMFVFFVDAARMGARDRVYPMALWMTALWWPVISWTLLKGATDDPIYLLSFMATLLWGGPSGSALLGRRPDGRGQSVLEWIGFTVMAVLYSVASIGFFGGGFFHSWAYVALCVAACAWAVVHLRQVWRSGAPLTSRHPHRRNLLASEK